MSDAIYDVAGRLTKMKYPAGGNLWRSQSYHAWTTAKNGGLLHEIKVGTSDGSNDRFLRQYTYNSFGDVASLKEGSTTYSFGYDNLGRLTDAYSKSYSYWPTNRFNSFEGQSYGYATPQSSVPYHGVKWAGIPQSSSVVLRPIRIRAKGSVYQNIWPQMEVWVNGVKRGSWSVSSVNWAEYTGQIPLSGRDQIDILFVNDGRGGNEDRNLWVDWVKVDPVGRTTITLQAESQGVIDRGSGGAAFDGDDVISGQEGIYWNAALRLVVGSGATAIGYDKNGNRSYRLQEGVADFYLFNAENRLAQVKRNGVVLESYAYDVDGNRIKKVSGEVTTYTWFPHYEEKVRTNLLAATRAAERGEWGEAEEQECIAGSQSPGCEDRFAVAPPGDGPEAESGEVPETGAGQPGQSYEDKGEAEQLPVEFFGLEVRPEGEGRALESGGVDFGFETATGWSEVPIAAYPARSFYRSTWGSAAPRTGSYGYALSNHAYGYLQSDPIPVAANSQYNLTAYVRGEVDAEDSIGAWSIRAYFYNSSGTYLSYVNAASGSSLSGAWEQKGGILTTPAGAASLRVYLFNYMNTGWVAYDDVALTQVGQTTNLVVNPSFESSGNWNAVKATVFPGTGFWRTTSGTGGPHSGSYGYAITNQSYGYLLSDSVPVSAGQQYDLYAWLQGELDPEGSNGAWIVRANFYNSSGTYLSYVNAASGSSLSGAWEQKGGRITAPAGAASLRVALYNIHNTGWVRFDDISLTAVGSGTNLTPNPGFESSGGWTESGHSSFPASSFFRTASAKRSGSYGYVLSNHSYGYLRSEEIAVNPGEMYELSAYVRGELDPEDSYGSWLIRAWFYDGAGNSQGYQNAASGGAGTLSTGWAQKGGTVSAPVTASRLRIQLYNYQNNGWAAYDDVSLGTVTKHYSFNGQRIAVRRGGVLRYTHTDHLGSSSGQTDASGNAIADSYLRYYAYGSLRSGNPAASTTDRTFTGQKSDGTGLLYYNARYYDPALGTFLSPDTLVPDAGRVIDYNRFLYVRANPLKYSDPSGHAPQHPGDPDSNNAPCSTDWCWFNRWYAAHGYGWDGRTWTRDLGVGGAIFYDAAILSDTMAEAGTTIPDMYDGKWKGWELVLVGQAVVDFSKKVGGMRSSYRLLGGSLLITRHLVSSEREYVAAAAYGNSEIRIYDGLFSTLGYSSYEAFFARARGSVIHEIGHILDATLSGCSDLHICAARNRMPSRNMPQSTFVSAYAQSSSVEYWAEAIATWVYGTSYGTTSLDSLQIDYINSRLAGD